MQNMRETILTKVKGAQNDKPSAREQHIMSMFGLEAATGLILPPRHLKPPLSLLSCQLPHPGYCKINFYGASHGNPGQASFGGVIRDEKIKKIGRAHV